MGSGCCSNTVEQWPCHFFDTFGTFGTQKSGSAFLAVRMVTAANNEKKQCQQRMRKKYSFARDSFIGERAKNFFRVKCTFVLNVTFYIGTPLYFCPCRNGSATNNHHTWKHNSNKTLLWSHLQPLPLPLPSLLPVAE